MRQQLWRWLKGYVSFEGSGGMTQRFLNMCTEKGLLIQKIKATPTGFCAETSAADYLKMHRLARACRCRLRVTKKIGWRYSQRQFLKRRGLIIGAAMFCLVMFCFPSLIWSMRFYSFTPEEEAKLRGVLFEKGIYEGSFITPENLEHIETAVFIENDEYAHISLNLFNGRITAEKADIIPPPEMFSTETSNVIALCDGIIQSWDITQGFLVVKKNQSVTKGQILVSGVGFGFTGQPYYLPAKADVYAQTEQTYKVTQPLTAKVLLPCSNTANSYKINGCGLELTVNNSLDAANTKESTSRYPLKVFGFALPLTVTQTQSRLYTQQTVKYTPQQAHDIALTRAYDALAADFPQHEIISAEESYETEENAVMLSVKFNFTANIAKTVDFNGN